MSINDPMMESKHHLPECIMRDEGTFQSYCIEECICDRLRQAEQRAIAAMREPGRIRVLIEEAEKRGYDRGYNRGYDIGRRDTLDAAVVG